MQVESIVTQDRKHPKHTRKMDTILNLDKSGNLALNLSVIKRLDPETTHVSFFVST
jgi:hypothetical protein